MTSRAACARSASSPPQRPLDDLVALATKKRWGAAADPRARRRHRGKGARQREPRAPPLAQPPRPLQTHGRLRLGLAHQDRSHPASKPRSTRLRRRRAQRRPRRTAGARQNHHRPKHRPPSHPRRPLRSLPDRRAAPARSRRPGISTRPRPPSPLPLEGRASSSSTRSAISPSTTATPTSSSRSSAAATRRRASSSPPISPSATGRPSSRTPPAPPPSSTASSTTPTSSPSRARATGCATPRSAPPRRASHPGWRAEAEEQEVGHGPAVSRSRLGLFKFPRFYVTADSGARSHAQPPPSSMQRKTVVGEHGEHAPLPGASTTACSPRAMGRRSPLDAPSSAADAHELLTRTS